MAGALSGHLVQSYESSMANQSICTDGQISFNPSMHRSFNPSMHSTHSQTFTSSMSESVFDRVNRLQAKLNQKLGPEFISQRPGPGGGPKLTYAEGWKIINIANDVFGFDGWSSNIVNMTTDYIDYNEETRRYNVGISVIMRVTVKEGVYHEDVGYGMIENAKGKGMALDKCKKEAVTDALKRTLRTFGNVLGNCLYDKQYTAEVVKIKVPPIKFEKADLHRIPQLSETPAPAASTSTSASSSRPMDSTSTAPAPASVPQQQKFQTPRPESNKPISAVPRNMQPTGLQTPITTPNHSTVERKVTFTPQVKVEPTAQTPTKPLQAQITPPPVPATHKQNEDAEDFGFFSDDDAFLSTVDLGEGDLGQPIDFEEGTGCISTSIQEESAPESAPVSLPQVAPTTNGRTAQGARLPAQQQQRRGTGAMPPPPNPPQHRTHGDDRGGTPATTGEKPISGWPAPPRPPQSASPRRQPAVSSNLSSGHAGGPPQARRPPSIGGFHFPPGMPNPFLQNQNPNKPPQPPQGVKRSADTMMSSSVTRSGQGMGLSAGGGARQPLGTLVLEPQKGPQGGSDIKRVKR